jgi:hypothetical protein
MKNIINAPVTIIPFDILKLKILAFLSGCLSDIIKTDHTDVGTINGMTDKMKEFLDCSNDMDVINFFKNDADTLFDPILLPYYEKDAIMVFVELRGQLYNLYKISDDALDGYDRVITIEEKT